MKCPECDKEFTKGRPWQRYCSLECGQKQRDKRRARRVKKALRHLKAAAAADELVQEIAESPL